jgi:hypothetical protein
MCVWVCGGTSLPQHQGGSPFLLLLFHTKSGNTNPPSHRAVRQSSCAIPKRREREWVCNLWCSQACCARRGGTLLLLLIHSREPKGNLSAAHVLLASPSFLPSHQRARSIRRAKALSRRIVGRACWDCAPHGKKDEGRSSSSKQGRHRGSPCCTCHLRLYRCRWLPATPRMIEVLPGCALCTQV